MSVVAFNAQFTTLKEKFTSSIPIFTHVYLTDNTARYRIIYCAIHNYSILDLCYS